MLSILIPIYNVDIRKLVLELHEQCTKAKVKFEIICFDDDSLSKYKEKNREVGSTIHVSYIELSENHGRSKIRNLLAQNSRYGTLLFLDSDSKIKRKKFIRNYIEKIESHPIIFGGRKYTSKPPQAKSKYLHWKYGSTRECPPQKKRNKYPYIYFHSNNFAIKKDVFDQVTFDISIQQYGYEDLVLGQSLQEAGHTIHHIDNPVWHTDLKNTDKFLSSIDMAIDNLAYLYYHDKLEKTRLTKLYRFLKHRELLGVFDKVYNRYQGKIKMNLHSEKPNLYYLDLYKLARFSNKYEEIVKSEEQ